MKVEKLLEEKIVKPDFSFISGSRLYGTNTPLSDEDIRGFTLPPFDYLLEVKNFECAELEGDHKIWSVKQFLRLALRGDPQSSEAFYCPEEQILSLSSLGKEIIQLKEDIISNRIYQRIMGYSYSEWRKAMGQKLIINERTLTEDRVINDIRNKFKPDKIDMDQVIDILMSKKERRIVPSKKDLGAKRKKEFDDYGYGVSCAAHSIRLVDQLYELVTTGNIAFPRPNADLLKDIRYGRVNKEEVNRIYDDCRHRADEAKERSVLRNEPNEKKVWEIYLKVVVDYIKGNEYFFKLSCGNEKATNIGRYNR